MTILNLKWHEDPIQRAGIVGYLQNFMLPYTGSIELTKKVDTAAITEGWQEIRINPDPQSARHSFFPLPAEQVVWCIAACAHELGHMAYNDWPREAGITENTALFSVMNKLMDGGMEPRVARDFPWTREAILWCGKRFYEDWMGHFQSDADWRVKMLDAVLWWRFAIFHGTGRTIEERAETFANYVFGDDEGLHTVWHAIVALTEQGWTRVLTADIIEDAKAILALLDMKQDAQTGANGVIRIGTSATHPAPGGNVGGEQLLERPSQQGKPSLNKKDIERLTKNIPDEAENPLEGQVGRDVSVEVRNTMWQPAPYYQLEERVRERATVLAKRLEFAPSVGVDRSWRIDHNGIDFSLWYTGQPIGINREMTASKGVPNEIVLIVDASQSMEKLERQLQESFMTIYLAMKKLEKSVVLRMHAVGPGKDVLFEGSSEEVKATIAGLRCKWGTNMGVVTEAEAQRLNRSRAQRRVLVLMTDAELVEDDWKQTRAAIESLSRVAFAIILPNEECSAENLQKLRALAGPQRAQAVITKGPANWVEPLVELIRTAFRIAP